MPKVGKDEKPQEAAELLLPLKNHLKKLKRKEVVPQ